MKMLFRLLGFGLLLAAASTTAWSQPWPSAAVKIVVPYPPGAEPDVLARDLASILAKRTGKTFVVENKPGANAIIGTDAVAKSPGDGNTLLMVDRLSVVTNPMLYRTLPYKWEQDLKPVSDIAAVRLFLSVRPDFPANTLREFVAYAKAKPDAVNVGIAGNGHILHIGMAMLAQAEGVSVNYVPYKGLAPTITGFLGGEVDALLAGGLATQQMAAAKPIKILAVGDDQRATYLPGVPTLAEAGGKAGSLPSTVFSIFAPGTMSAATVHEVQKQLAAAADEEFVSRYVPRGLVVKTSSPEAMTQDLRREQARFDTIIKALNLKLD